MEQTTSQHNIRLIRFKASDGVELCGWFTNKDDTNTAVIHLHGMSGNGYENKFLDHIRDSYLKNEISFFTINTRGSGIISNLTLNNNDGTTSLKKGGSCYEVFQECVYDIEGAIETMKDLGKTRIILQGHSLGCSKVVYYLTANMDLKFQKLVKKIVLLAPTNVIKFLELDNNHKMNYQKAQNLQKNNNGAELVDFYCGYFKFPISADSYISLSTPQSPVDIYSNQKDSDSSLGRLEILSLIVYGDVDMGIIDIYGSVENYIKEIDLFNNSNIKIEIIKGANHGYNNLEEELCKILQKFIVS